LKEYEQMSLYYDGELSGEELEDFEKRLQDPEFARRYAKFAQTLVNIADIPLAEPPAALREGIMARVREEARPVELFGETVEKERSRRRGFRFQAPRSFRPYFGAAAAVVACVFVIGGIFSLFGTLESDVAPTPLAFGDSAPIPAAGEAEAFDTQTRLGGQVPYVASPETAARQWDAMSLPPDITAEDRIVRSAEITLEVGNLDEAVRFINTLSGYNESVNINHYNIGREVGFAWSAPRSSAHIVRRVPLDLFNGHITTLRELGRIVSESENTHSVSTSLHNAQARRDALSNEIGRLLGYLEQADSVGDMTLISARIGIVEQEILDAQGQIAHFENSVGMPVVRITALEVWEDVQDYGPTGFWEDIRVSFAGSLELTGAVLSGIGVLIAGLVLPALFVLVLALVSRRVFRRLAHPNKSSKGEDVDEV